MGTIDGLRGLRRNPHIVAASLAANMLGLTLPIVMIQIYDRVIPNAAFATLTALAMGLFVALLAESALRIARSQLLAMAGAKFEVDAYDTAFQNLLGPDHRRGESLAVGTLYTQLMSIDRYRAHHTGEAAAAYLDIPFIFIFIGLMLLIAPVLGAAVLVFVATVFLIVRVLRRKVIALNADRQEADARRQSFLIETLTGIEVIKSLHVEDFMERRYDRLMAGSAPISATLSYQLQLTQGVAGAIGLIAPVAMAGVGALLVLGGQMSIGGLAASVLLTGRIIQPVLRIEALLVGEEDIKRIEKDLKELLVVPTRKAAPKKLESIQTIELRSVTYCPKPEAPPLLDNVSLMLKRGDCITLTGAEGSGRSSFLSLLAGHIQPQAGEVLINGHPVDQYEGKDLRDRITLLSRDESLLEGTLLENLTGFDVDTRTEAALALVDELGVGKFIAKHSEGLAMQIPSGGKSLLPTSVSDCVLMIAGLASRADLILFDEANVGLDHDVDRRLLAYLGRRLPNSISVLVSHRPSYMRLASQHFELIGGKLLPAKAGPPLDLGRYAVRVA